MITIGSEIRGLPLGDIAAVPIEPIIIEDIFGEIVAGMTAAAAAESVGDEPAAPALAEEGETPVADVNAAANVLQLLTVTVKQQARALKERESEEPQPEAEADGQTPRPAEGAAAVHQIAPPVAQSAQAAAPSAAAVPSAAAQAPVQLPDPASATRPRAQAVAARPANPLEPPVTFEGEKVEEPETKSPMARAVSEIMQATRQLGLPQVRRAAPEPILRRDDPAPAHFGQEVKQVVRPAISPVQAQTVPLPFDIVRPAEVALEPMAVEPRIDPAEFAIERQLDLSAEGEWLDSLARDIARTAGEGGTLRFRLNPENLGTLRVEITPQANGSAVRLTADSDAARTIIADAQPRLVAEARANGVRIAETHVDLDGQNPSGDPRRHNAQFEEAPLRTARFLQDQDDSDGKPTRSQSERYA